ncbi:MAG: hypothetical protein ACQESF_01690 [Nanobdellota archaeon]
MNIKNLTFASLLIVALVIAGCSQKSNVSDEGPGAEVITLKNDCRDAGEEKKEECCNKVCNDYCNSKGFKLSKFETFSTNCGCWCSE